MYAAPAVNAGACRMEGVHIVALALKEVRKAQGKGVGGVAAVWHTHRRGHKARLGDDLRVECARREEQRGVEVGELHALVQKLAEVRHILGLCHPGVYALKHHQHEILALQAPAELVGRRNLPALEDAGQLLNAAAVRAYAKGDGEVPGGILVQARKLQAAVGVGKALVYHGPRVIGRVPGHHIALLWHEPLVDKAQPQSAETRHRKGTAPPYPELLARDLWPLGQHHGRGYHQQEQKHEEVHLLRQPEVCPAEKLCPVPGKIHIGKAEKMAEDVVHHTVQHHQKGEEHPQHAHGDAPPSPWQQGRKAGYQQRPAAGEGHGLKA